MLDGDVLLALFLGSIVLLLGYFVNASVRGYLRQRAWRKQEEARRASGVPDLRHAFLGSSLSSDEREAARKFSETTGMTAFDSRRGPLQEQVPKPSGQSADAATRASERPDFPAGSSDFGGHMQLPLFRSHPTSAPFRGTVSRANVESVLQSLGFRQEASEILAGWNDAEDIQTCRMLSTLGVNRAFVEQNRNTYFRKNVYDEVKPRLEARLLKAEQSGDQQALRALKALVEIFDVNRESLQQVTEASTLLAHMKSCPKHQ